MGLLLACGSSSNLSWTQLMRSLWALRFAVLRHLRLCGCAECSACLACRACRVSTVIHGLRGCRLKPRKVSSLACWLPVPRCSQGARKQQKDVDNEQYPITALAKMLAEESCNQHQRAETSGEVLLRPVRENQVAILARGALNLSRPVGEVHHLS